MGGSKRERADLGSGLASAAYCMDMGQMLCLPHSFGMRIQ